MASKTTDMRMPSTLGTWALLIDSVVKKISGQSLTAFGEFGLDPIDIKEKQLRIPVDQMEVIWDEAKALTQKNHIALLVAKDYQPTVFSNLGMSLMASETAFDAINRIFRFATMLSNGINPEMNQDEENITIIIKRSEYIDRAFNPEGIEAFIATFVKILRMLSTRELNPLEVSFQHGCSDPSPYVDYFKCDIKFNEDVNQISFKLDQLNDKNMFSNQELVSVLDRWVEQNFSQFESQGVVRKVQKFIMSNMYEHEITQELVAKEFAMSTRVLQRELQKEDTNFRDILDDCRHRLAIQLLTVDKLPIIEVTIILGFTDQSNFTRAFKRWTGQTPKEFVNAS